MRRIIAVAGLIIAGGMSIFAQDWSEYSRGSESWHRHNRDAMFRPWKYDRGGRLKRGNRTQVRRASHSRRHKRR